MNPPELTFDFVLGIMHRLAQGPVRDVAVWLLGIGHAILSRRERQGLLAQWVDLANCLHHAGS